MDIRPTAATFEANTRVLRGSTRSQVLIDPLVNSAPTKLAAIRSETSPTPRVTPIGVEFVNSEMLWGVARNHSGRGARMLQSTGGWAPLAGPFSASQSLTCCGPSIFHWSRASW